VLRYRPIPGGIMKHEVIIGRPAQTWQSKFAHLILNAAGLLIMAAMLFYGGFADMFE